MKSERQAQTINDKWLAMQLRKSGVEITASSLSSGVAAFAYLRAGQFELLLRLLSRRIRDATTAAAATVAALHDNVAHALPLPAYTYYNCLHALHWWGMCDCAVNKLWEVCQDCFTTDWQCACFSYCKCLQYNEIY